ncbi:MAG: hypothetical protein ABWZ66_11805 [Pyrinomonadaceae bacterium]
MPTPTPENEQIESVREIAKLTSFAEAQTLVSSLNDEQWTATLADITLWGTLKNQFTVLKGGRSGVVIDPKESRLEITNRVRNRLGLADIGGETSDFACDNYTESIPIEVW